VQAHLEYARTHGSDTYLERPDVGEEMEAAAHQSLWHPAYQPSLLTASVLNQFARALARADRFLAADRCFAALGTTITGSPWEDSGDDAVADFRHWRSYVRESIEYHGLGAVPGRE
jgi:hypothetical protein